MRSLRSPPLSTPPTSPADAVRLPWWKPGLTLADVRAETLQLWPWNHLSGRKRPSLEDLEAFRKHCATELVFLSCKLEQSVPPSLTREDVAADLEEAYDRCLEESEEFCFLPCSSPWPSDGSQDDLAANKNQMIQHMKALCFLCYMGCQTEPLTPVVLQRAHSILLNKATDAAGNALHSGIYRTHPAHSSGLVFMEPLEISHAVEDALAKYVTSEQDTPGPDQQFFIERVAQLYFKLIMIHPFTDGNGRLCRLLIAAALMREGVPFPVPMHNGHKKNRLHYMGVTGHADTHLNTHRLQCYLLDCVLLWLKCFLEKEQDDGDSVAGRCLLSYPSVVG
ncbi:hypothetical protein L7F22_049270 [Adiantum nelumboides]|nr:hypothetical protein [Adiantum nelumboides]